jgi:hypothetical protein
MSNNAIAVYASALKREAEEHTPTRDATRNSTSARETPRDTMRTELRAISREKPRDSSRDYPSRDAIQEFSFRLRDELKVKVQAEVPHHWQEELDDLAREIGVKKLELYRYIIGEFLGKVTRQCSP